MGVPAQAPPLHVSPDVQALPSSQAALFGVKVQPLTGLQLSSVHTLLSLQPSGVPGLQTPLPQVSPCVQALPSLQGAVLLTKVQPPLPSHASVVQGLPSSQLYAVPLQVPFAQVSFLVQALPSSQEVVFGVNVHPPKPSHASVVQTLPSSQEYAVPLHDLPSQ